MSLCIVTGADEMPFVSQVGKQSRDACDLMSPGSEQVFAVLLLSVCQGFAQKLWPSRALCHSSAAPPVYLTSLHRSVLATADRGRKPLAAAWSYPHHCRDACGELELPALVQELLTLRSSSCLTQEPGWGGLIPNRHVELRGKAVRRAFWTSVGVCGHLAGLFHAWQVLCSQK